MPATVFNFADQLTQWQKAHGRHHLPWQRTRDPYRVWLSEIMLQQTQVNTVVAYFERFLESFPSISLLAQASIDEILSLWSGLGYYSRAHNLHRCARIVHTQHNGTFPKTSALLMKLPGIGRSTAAAIAATCFNERISIMDGNVKRVLARFLAFNGDLSSIKVQNALWEKANTLLPLKSIDMPSYTQALMDLGALVCHKTTPICSVCPVQSQCQAFRNNTIAQYPLQTKKLKRTQENIYWLCAVHYKNNNPSVLLYQRPKKGIWSQLFCFPEFDSIDYLNHYIDNINSIYNIYDNDFCFPNYNKKNHPSFIPFKHALTHKDLLIHPILLKIDGLLTKATDRHNIVTIPPIVSDDTALSTPQWHTVKAALALGLPAPVRTVLQQLNTHSLKAHHALPTH